MRHRSRGFGSAFQFAWQAAAGNESGSTEPVWLNTGDAELLEASDLAGWHSAYRPWLRDVRVLALPHHGSDRNSNRALQAHCPNALLTAHVTSGSAKHPGPDVSLAAGARLACVTEQPGTEVEMRFCTH